MKAVNLIQTPFFFLTSLIDLLVTLRTQSQTREHKQIVASSLEAVNLREITTVQLGAFWNTFTQTGTRCSYGGLEGS